MCEGPDGRKITSGDAAFKTEALDGAIRLPSGDDPPYVLDKPKATYLLTQDIEAEGTAFEIRAAGITLDLDGHTVTYGTRARDIAWDRPKNAVHGVLVSKPPNVRVLNGVIRQGAPNTNCHGVHIRGGDNPELAGLTVETVGDSAGVYSEWGFALGRIHHSRFLDNANRWVRTGGWWNPRACIRVGGPGG